MHIKMTAVPDTMLVASPPFRSRNSMAVMSPRKARGVRIARNKAPLAGNFADLVVSRMDTEAVSQIRVLRFKRNAVITVVRLIVRNKGRPSDRIWALGIPAALAVMAGAP